MAKFKVYISSVKREFEQIREEIFTVLNTRTRLYDATGMEAYTAEDIPAVEKCRQDVRDCNIYVCILGQMYGSIVNDGRGLSFTHHEYEEAGLMKAKDKSFARLLFVKEPFYENDDHPNLTAIKKQVLGVEQKLVKVFKNNADLPNLILDALDNCICNLHKTTGENTVDESSLDKVYLCDRRDPAAEFDQQVDTSTDAVQFFLINSHEKDMPHFFIRRKEMELAEQEHSTHQLYLNPVILENDNSFEALEYALKAAIKMEWDKHKGWPKFKTASNVTVENGFAFMKELNLDILIIAWQIQSIHWKSDLLRDHISAFYKKYALANSSISTSKKILFVGILSYNTGSALTREQFEQKVSTILYGKPLSKFAMINRYDIKQWLVHADIEDNPDIQENIIEVCIPDENRDAFYLSELETPLKNIIRKCAVQTE